MSFLNPSQTTVEVPPQHQFDSEKLREYLNTTLGLEATELTVRKFGYGQSNPTYLLTLSLARPAPPPLAQGSTLQLVMRKRPAGQLIASAHRVDREFRVLKALGGAGFEVPRVLAFSGTPSPIGTAFYVMTFEKGIIASNTMNNVPVETRKPRMLSMVRVLGKLHSLSPRELGLVGGGHDFGREGGFYARQLTTLAGVSAKQVAMGHGKVPPLPRGEQLVAEFQRQLPADRSCIIHGDYKPDNVILNASNNDVLCVVDWELSTIGHPLSDLANFCLPYHFKSSESGLFVSMLDTEGVASEEEVLLEYCNHTATPYPIKDWNFSVAFACLRLAVICQGVLMRHATGQASDTGGRDNVAKFEDAVRSLTELAWHNLKLNAQPSHRL